jgi:hypothetical protein
VAVGAMPQQRGVKGPLGVLGRAASWADLGRVGGRRTWMSPEPKAR